MATAAANTFPVCNADDLISFFRTEVLTEQEAQYLTKGDFVPRPKPESVLTVYIRVLQLLCPFKPECHSMIPLAENFQNPEFHEGSTPILNVHMRMCQFLPMCLIFDFSLNDLLMPKKQRTLTILSAIMNFLLFRKRRMGVVWEKQSKFRADTEQLQAYMRDNQEAERKINILRTIPPEQQAEANELAAALAELQTATTHEYKEVESRKESIAEWKARIAEMTQKLAQIKVDVSNMKDVISNLKSQIVESPEELKSQMEKMRESVKTIKLSFEQTDERVVELQTMAQSVTHAELEVQQIMSFLQDLESSMNKCKQRQEANQEQMTDIENKQKELKNLRVQEGQLKRALGMKLDKESKQNIRRQKKREMKDHHVEESLRHCNQIQQKREEMADKIQEICRATQQLKAKIKSLQEVCSEETQKAQILYDTVKASMKDLHLRIQSNVLDVKQMMSKKAPSC
ncbi:kinetochore protein Nuf2-like isoform X1 [Synchiropus splendidus]|uniref:kinetochore protein Nuf2-like isoform X1 n=1 Tax=Synchiropus splendidus TaxID=270530 RepID=UPI00237D7B9B|nr:kinetochore protein Nuf2-like isoform X1 [Synchiropus splendidus]